MEVKGMQRGEGPAVASVPIDADRRGFLKEGAAVLALLAVPAAWKGTEQPRHPAAGFPRIRTRELRARDLGPARDLAG